MKTVTVIAAKHAKTAKKQLDCNIKIIVALYFFSEYIFFKKHNKTFRNINYICSINIK